MKKTLINRNIEDTTERFSSILAYSACDNEYMYLYDNINSKISVTDIYNLNNTYRLHDSLYIIVLQGEVSFVINNVNYTIERKSCSIITSKSIIKLTHAMPNTKFICIRLTDKATEESFDDLGLYKNKALSNYALIKELTTEEYDFLTDYYKELCNGLLRKDQEYPHLFARSYNNILHVFNINLYDIDTAIIGEAVSRQENLFRQFIDLLNEYANKEREVQFYADKLNITPKYLSTITNAYSGKNASLWIAEYVVTLAKNLMREKNCRIQDVSEMLNFPSQSFFGRFFKRTTGISPKRYVMTNLE